MREYIYNYQTPIGNLQIIANEQALVRVVFRDPKEMLNTEQTEIIKETTKQLEEYFAGMRQEFDLSIELGGTIFQKQVWDELQCIPYGDIITYSELAKRINRPRAVRAAGSANGKNPFSIIVPCHRVIGSDGKLHGYAGGLERKAWLIEHEQKYFR